MGTALARITEAAHKARKQSGGIEGITFVEFGLRKVYVTVGYAGEIGLVTVTLDHFGITGTTFRNSRIGVATGRPVKRITSSHIRPLLAKIGGSQLDH